MRCEKASVFRLYWGFLYTFHSLQKSKENFTNRNHIIILYFIVVNKSCNTYSIKFGIFKERFFSDTHFINEMFGKINFHEEMSKKLWFSRQNFPKMANFKEYFSLLSLHPFLCKEFSLPKFSLFAKILRLLSSIQYSKYLPTTGYISPKV